MNQTSNKTFFAIVIIGGAGVVYMLYSAMKYLQSDTRSEHWAAQQEVDKDELSYDKLWYKNSAKQLFTAMDGAATNEAAIFRVIESLKNKSDYNKLYIEFGEQENTSFYDSFKGNLAQWIIEELSGSDLDRVLNHLESIGVEF